eukprot:5714870-Pyramimonas_sp.AAC.1
MGEEGGLNPPFEKPQASSRGPVLDPLWRSWGRLGALLGVCGGPLGPSGSSLKASDNHRKRRAENATSNELSYVCEGFWRLVGLPWKFGTPLGPPLSVHGVSGGILGAMWGHQGLAKAIVEKISGSLKLSWN